jgi:large subunit ribosomal protein L29
LFRATRFNRQKKDARKMKTHEIRELTTEELQARSRELKDQSMHLRIQKATGQMENKAVLGHLKKEVARILTILRERKLGIRQSAAGAPAAAPAKPKSAAKNPAPKKKAAAKKTAKKAE